jgi:hypothetical protein
MKELMLIMSKLMPIDKIIEEIKKSLTEYEADPKPVNQMTLMFFMQVFILKVAAEGKPMDEMLKEMSTVEQIRARMSSEGN